MKTPLRYPGGKSRAAKHILPLIPKDCKELCSPFLGGGSVELAVAEKYGTQIYGYDLFKPLVWFWQALLEDPERLATIVDSFRVENSYEHQGETQIAKGLPLESFKSFREDIRKELELDSPKFSYDLAAKVYAINRSSFSGATLSGGFSKRASYARFTDSSVERIRDFKETKLTVVCADFKQSIPQHPDAFLYLDPPYLLGKDKDRLYGDGGSTHEGFDHRGLYEIISQRSRWVLSYNNCEEIRELYKNYKMIDASWAYGMKATYTEEEKERRECLQNAIQNLKKYQKQSESPEIKEIIKSIAQFLKVNETKKMGSSSELLIIG